MTKKTLRVTSPQINYGLIPADPEGEDLFSYGEEILDEAESRLHMMADDMKWEPNNIRAVQAVFSDGTMYIRLNADASGHEKLVAAEDWTKPVQERFEAAYRLAVAKFAACCDIPNTDDISEIHSGLARLLTEYSSLPSNFRFDGLNTKFPEGYSRAEKIRFAGRRIASLYDCANPPFVSADCFKAYPKLPFDLWEEFDDQNVSHAIVTFEYVLD